nr:MAG TPA: hypothetical protein [Caudoviricetes sp.]
MQVMLLQIYGALLRKVKAQGVTQEKIDIAVESYLERNPIKKIEYDSKKRLLR